MSDVERYSLRDKIAARAGDYLRAFHASHAVALGDALIAATASVHQDPH
jgi:hypothetical protein